MQQAILPSLYSSGKHCQLVALMQPPLGLPFPPFLGASQHFSSTASLLKSVAPALVAALSSMTSVCSDVLRNADLDRQVTASGPGKSLLRGDQKTSVNIFHEEG